MSTVLFLPQYVATSSRLPSLSSFSLVRDQRMRGIPARRKRGCRSVFVMLRMADHGLNARSGGYAIRKVVGLVPRIAVLVGRPAGDVRAWLRSDPCFNVGAARWIFLSALRTAGDYWLAVGVYHSPTEWRQRRYAWSVARHMQRRFGGDIFSALRPILNATQVGFGSGDPIQPPSTSVKMRDLGIFQDPSN